MGITIVQGKIRLNPHQKNKIKAFTPWVKYHYRLVIDPTRLSFLDTHTAELLIRVNTHQLFVYKSYTISKAANPVRLTKQVKWEYWAPTFINYVRYIPGRDGVPLKYIIGSNDLPDLTPNKVFLDDYVKNATLMGESFTIYASEVHTFIVNLISQNEESEYVIKVHEDKIDGRKDWKALKSHYEGIGKYSNDITKSNLDLRTITYTG